MSSNRPRSRPLRRFGRVVALTALAALLALGAHLVWRHASGNFGVIVPGEAYRSAQVDAETIGLYRARYGIASILNLRGTRPGKAWYDEEVAASAALGITHADFAMSSGHMLSQERAEELIALMDRLPKPLLIHCEEGANRTGLASALYLAKIDNATEEVAEAQMSLRFGHFAIAWPESLSPMYATFEALEGPLGIEESPGSS